MDRPAVSIIIPVYNEEKTVSVAIRRVLETDFGPKLFREIIVVNDGSTDTTPSILESFIPQITVIHMPGNRGKGAAVRAGFGVANGDIFIVHDADLEYDPVSHPLLIDHITNNRADIVYGSRFLSGDNFRRRADLWYLANLLLTISCNAVTRLRLTDMETGMKAFRRTAILSVTLAEDRFGFEPEVTIKLARRGWRFMEIPINYRARSRAAGKKISWRDGLEAIWIIFNLGIGIK